MHDVKKFFWDEPYLYRSCADGLIRCCVPEVEMLSVLEACIPGQWVGIIVVSGLPIRFCSVGTIGQLFINMFMILTNHVIGASEMEEF